MQVVTIKPQPGTRVVDPVTRQAIPISGCSVTLDKYWRRRIASGEVELLETVVRTPDVSEEEATAETPRKKRRGAAE